MVVESGCEILFHTYFSDVIMRENQVVGMIVENKSGRQAIFGKVIIDATGDGDVAARAGVPFWQIKEEEAHRLDDCLMYKISGFDPDTDLGGCLFQDHMVLWGPSTGMHNGADGKELTQMEIEARRNVFEHFENLKKNVLI